LQYFNFILLQHLFYFILHVCTALGLLMTGDEGYNSVMVPSIFTKLQSCLEGFVVRKLQLTVLQFLGYGTILINLCLEHQF